MKFHFFVFVFFIIGLNLFGQEHAPDETKVLMRREVLASLHFNTGGWGVGGYYGFQKNYKYKHTVGFLFDNIRHSKEQKIFPDQILNSRGYFYGKLYSLVSLRFTYGGKYILFQSKRENGIEITAKWDTGPSFGLLKPVYLRIDSFNSTMDERYDPSIHNTSNISSRSSWFKGFGESKFQPGVFFRAGLDFNFSSVREVISGGEVGVMADYFLNDIALLYNNNGQHFYPFLYLQLNFGYRLY